MRIFSPQLGLNPDSSSGGEVYDVKILTGLAKRGHKVDVLLMRGEETPPNMKNLNIKYTPFKISTSIPWRKSIYSYVLIPFLLQSNKEIISSVDVFRVHMPYSIALNAYIFKFFRRGICPPLWFHYHHIENEFQMRRFRNLPKYADGITVDNRATLEDLKKICPDVKGKFCKVINIGTDTDLFKPSEPDMKLKSKLGISKDDKVVLFVGHLVHRKGIDILMESWKNILREFKDVRLVLLGKGNIPGIKKDNSLEHLIPRNKHERDKMKITHIGERVTQEDLIKYYNIADVFAFPTRLEGHGMTAAEAMSCGVPVVTTNAKGIRDVVVDGKTGYKVNINDVEKFSEKMKILLSDDSLRKRMGIAARKHIEKNWTWKNSIDQTEKFMKELVGTK